MLRNFSILTVGTAIAQLIAVGFQLITRRLYTPEDFGAFALYFSIVNVLFILASLQLNRSIVLPKKNTDTNNLVILGLQIVLIISFILGIIFLTFGNIMRHWLNFPDEYKVWFYFIPLTVCVFAMFDIFNYFLIRQKSFKYSAIAKIIRRSTEGASQSGLSVFSKFGLFFGDLFAQFVNLFFAIFASGKSGFNLKDYNIQLQIKLLGRYSDFPKYSTVPTLLNTISLFFPIIIVNKIFGTTETGQLDMARMVLTIPLALISTSVFQVLLQRTSERRTGNLSIYKDILKVGSVLTITAILGIIVLFLIANPLFSVFGNQWQDAIDISKLLVFSFAIKFVVSPLSSVFTSLERIRIASLWQVIYFTALLSLFFLPNNTLMILIRNLVLIDIISYTIYLILILFEIYKYERSVINK